MAKMTEARKRANEKYNSQFVQLRIRIMGSDRERYKTHTTIMNESMNSFIIRAIEHEMERDIAAMGSEKYDLLVSLADDPILTLPKDPISPS